MHSAHRNTIEGSCLTVADTGPMPGSTKFPAARSLALASVVGLLLIAARPMGAQQEAVLYSFPGYSNGETPQASMIVDSKGNLYGTTAQGGAKGYGAVFEITLPANGAPKEKVLHSFPRNSNPVSSLVLDPTGTLYGTTEGGGIVNGNCPFGCGTVFSLKGSKHKLLYNFTGGDNGDGGNPYGGLVTDGLGNFYGTTAYGGASTTPTDNGCGTIFQISGGVETILYSFSGVGDGCNPMAGLFIDSSGILYGTTQQGGSGYGTVFELDPSSSTLITLYYFGGGSDGAYPLSSLVMDDFGFLYGTTQQGGGFGCGGNGCGTVYTVDPTGLSGFQLYAFTGGVTDGANPYGALAVDSGFNLYGTTYSGGTSGSGIVFELLGGTTEQVLHNFEGYPDGTNPVGGLVINNKDCHLYGTTTAGGTSHRGTVFYVIPRQRINLPPFCTPTP